MHFLLNAVLSSLSQYLSALLVSDQAHGHHRLARATAVPQVAPNPSRPILSSTPPSLKALIRDGRNATQFATQRQTQRNECLAQKE